MGNGTFNSNNLYLVFITESTEYRKMLAKITPKS